MKIERRTEERAITGQTDPSLYGRSVDEHSVFLPRRSPSFLSLFKNILIGYFYSRGCRPIANRLGDSVKTTGTIRVAPTLLVTLTIDADSQL